MPLHASLILNLFSGEVIHLEVLGRTMINLDSYRAAVDLLDKRGSVYSDRPKFIVYKLLQKAEDFKSMQTQEARTLVRNLIESTPDEYEKFMSRFATGIITQIVAGHRTTSNDDPYLRLSDMIAEAITEMGPPGVQHFPPWFPGAHHVGGIRAWRSTMQELYDYPLYTKVGEALPPFILAQLERTEKSEDDDEDLKGAVAAMFAAGESTVFLYSDFGNVAWMRFVDMGYTGQCQVKAQKEIDSVVGDLRFPDFEDHENLPFVECILQETLRVPHRVMEDNEYRGMFIPKGSLVFANIRRMSLDEGVYSDPKSFFPERFLPKPAGKGEPHFSNVAFGFGRRICSGQCVADNSVWIAIASILASSNISNAVDEDGNVIVPESKLTDGLATRKTLVSPRPSGAKALILGTAG
ncbi:cytochrome P450 [Mycena leptocephala]|nr:cytochrome P450 [Mycena leptocephala]